MHANRKGDGRRTNIGDVSSDAERACNRCSLGTRHGDPGVQRTGLMGGTSRDRTARTGEMEEEAEHKDVEEIARQQEAKDESAERVEL